MVASGVLSRSASSRTDVRSGGFAPSGLAGGNSQHPVLLRVISFGSTNPRPWGVNLFVRSLWGFLHAGEFLDQFLRLGRKFFECLVSRVKIFRCRESYIHSDHLCCLSELRILHRGFESRLPRLIDGLRDTWRRNEKTPRLQDHKTAGEKVLRSARLVVGSF